MRYFFFFLVRFLKRSASFSVDFTACGESERARKAYGFTFVVRRSSKSVDERDVRNDRF